MKHLFPGLRKMLYVVAVGFGLAISASQSAQAQTPGATGIAITPPIFELSANPGDTLTHTIRVDNLTTQSLSLTIDRKDFVPLGEEGQAQLTDEPTPFSLSNWIKPDKETLTIEAKGSQSVSFRIIVPTNAEPGGHFGSLVFRTIPRPDGSSNLVSQEIGALILLKVAGVAKEKASVLSFAPTKNLWEKTPVEFEARFRNEGNVQVKPTGAITISNIFGRKVGSVSVESRTVLPESIRKIRGSWKGSGWPGWYTATLSMNYGSDRQIITSSAKFFVLPYKIILPIIGALVIVGFLAFKGRKRIKRSLRILLGKE